MRTELNHVELGGEAQDVQGSLELLRTLNPDVMTLDIKLPGESGLVLLGEITKPGPLHGPIRSDVTPGVPNRGATPEW